MKKLLSTCDLFFKHLIYPCMCKELIVCRAFRPQITHNVEFQTIEIDWNIEKTFVLGHVTLNWVTNEAKTKVSNHRQSSLSSASLFSENFWFHWKAHTHTQEPHLSGGVCHKPVFTENKVVTEGRVTAWQMLAPAWRQCYTTTKPIAPLTSHCTTIPGHGGSVGARLGIIVHSNVECSYQLPRPPPSPGV